MTLAVRLSAALLLAGLGLVSLPGEVWAENTRWKFQIFTDSFTDVNSGSVFSSHLNGGHIFFLCQQGKPIDKFLAFVVTVDSDRYFEDKIIEVTWRTDKGAVHRENWHRNLDRSGGGVVINAQQAVSFARSVMRANERIIFRNPNGTIEFDAKGSTKAISQLFDFCGLPQ